MAKRRDRASSAETKSSKPESPYSYSWMGAFLGKVECTLDLPAACKAQGISLPELQRLREADPAFDRAMMAVDDSLERAIVDQIRAKAATGDVRATSLYLRRRPELLALVRHEELVEELDPDSAELMILLRLHPSLRRSMLTAVRACIERAGRVPEIRENAEDEATEKPWWT